MTMLYLRIEIHILSLCWIMKNISILMSVKQEIYCIYEQDKFYAQLS